MTVQAQVEQRKHRRYTLSCPVQVWSKSRPGPPIQASSGNISAHGIYLILSQEFELGSELELEITLPLKLPGGKVSLVRCRGKLARVERMNPDGKIGVGSTIDYFELCNEARTSEARVEAQVY